MTSAASSASSAVKYFQSPSGTVALLLAAGFLLRLYLIYRYPPVFGSDTVARLAHADRIVLGHQLPLLQAGIHYLSVFSQDPLLVRWYMAVLGAVAGVGFYLGMTNLVSRAAARDAALLFTTSPFILAHSVVPYQEILMLAGLCFAWHFAHAKRWALASLSLGLACLTRYEAWLAAPVFGLAYLRATGWSWGAMLRGAAIAGWAPLAWMLYSGGITPAEGTAVEWSTNVERLLRWLHVGGTTLRHTPLPVLVLAALGGITLWRRRLFQQPPYRALAAFLALFLVAILFSAHGVGEQPERVVTNREAHVPLVAVIVLAGLGLDGVSRWRGAVTAACVLVGLGMSDAYVRRATTEPTVALSYRLARYLEREVAPGERAAVIARAIDLEAYLAQEPEAARTVEALGMGRPPAFQRTRVQVRWGRERVVSFATPPAGPVAETPGPQWVALWSDHTITNAVEAGLVTETRALEPRQTFAEGGLTVRVYALSGAHRP